MLLNNETSAVSATAMQMAQKQNGQQGINNSLKYKTITVGQKQGPWEINWSLKHNAKKGGWIVQHIVADFAGAVTFPPQTAQS